MARSGQDWVRTLAALVLTLGVLPCEAAPPTPKIGPEFTSVVRVLETQPIAGARLVYWDQSAADALGVRVPPGRVGQPDFERAVLARYALEIRQGSARLDQAPDVREGNSPYLFVEEDAHGGAGRAGYVQAEPDVWVNIKGAGLTGEGHSRGSKPGPPSGRFVNHGDGSMTLEEAIKEAILSRVADAELKQGAGRVLGIIATGRTLEYPDGRRAPLAAVLRVPVTRYDQDPRQGRALAAIGEASAKRIMKGDFVNPSNLGALGEMVDFGCMTHVCGYGPIGSSQRETFLYEGFHVLERVHDPALMERIGEELLGQLGVPESHRRRARQIDRGLAARFETLTQNLRYMSAYDRGFGRRRELLVDFEPVSPDELHGAFRLPDFFAEAAPNFVDAVARDPSPAGRAALLEREHRRLLALATAPGSVPDELSKVAREFVSELHAALESVRRANPVADPAAHARALRAVARHKNRAVPELLRPELFRRSGELAEAYAAGGDPELVQRSIEELLRRTRTGTVASAANGIVVRADARATEVLVRAFTDPRGVARLFAYPELEGAAAGETFHFRVTTDGWRTHHDRIARVVATSAGDYLSFELPHGLAAVTEEPIELAPFVRGADGSVRWVAEGRNLRGPPLLLNERLGLPADFTPERSFIEQYHGRRMRLLADDLEPARPSLGPREPIESVVLRLRSRHEAFRVEALRDLELRKDLLNRSLASDSRLRREFAAAIDLGSPADEFARLYAFVRESVADAGLRARADGRLVRRVAAGLRSDEREAANFRRWAYGPAFRGAEPAVRLKLVAHLRGALGNPDESLRVKSAVAAGMMQTPEGLAFLDELIEMPGKGDLAVAALASPDLRGSAEVRPRVRRLLAAGSAPRDLAPLILGRWLREDPELWALIDVLVDEGSPAILEPLVREVLPRLPHDDLWAARVDRLIGRADLPKWGIAEHLLSQHEALDRPEAPRWFERIVSAPDSPKLAWAKQLPRLGQKESWADQGPLLDRMMDVALAADDATAIEAGKALGTRHFDRHPRLGEWLGRVASRPQPWPALLAFVRNPNAWRTPEAEGWMARALTERSDAVTNLVRDLLSGGWGRHPRAREFLLQTLRASQAEVALALERHVAKGEIWEFPGFDEWVRRAARTPRLAPSLTRAILDRGADESAGARVADTLAEVLRDGQFPPGASDGGERLFVGGWHRQPRFRELVALAEQRGLIGPRGFQKSLLSGGELSRHPATPLWIEELIRSGRWESRNEHEFMLLQENAALRLACGGQEIRFDCLRAAFDRGFTYRGSLRSPDSTLREAMSELLERYGQRTGVTHLESPWLQELGAGPPQVAACGLGSVRAIVGVEP